MIIKNEAAHLPRCLASVQSVVTEIVVVDTGSTDATPALAAAAGARVFHFPWQGDFSAARNFGLDQAQGEWILVLDADEALAPASAPCLSTYLQTSADGLLVTVRNLYPPTVTALYGDAESVRLFRNRPAYRYEQRVHEQIAPVILQHGGQLAAADLYIEHYGYQIVTAQGDRDRQQRNLELLRPAVAAEPDNVQLRALLGITLGRLNQFTEAESVLHAAAAAALPPEIRHEVLLMLGSLAFARQDIDTAAQYAEASLSCVGPDSLTAWRLLAHASLAKGEALLTSTIQPAMNQLETVDLIDLAQQVGQALRAYHTARAAFDQLRQEPRLNPAFRSEVEAGRKRCAQMRVILGKLAAVLPPPT